MPAFLLLVLSEKLYGYLKGKDTVRNMDMLSSLTSGITNVTKDVLGLSLSILSYQWMVTHLAFVHIQSTLLVYIIAFIALDFAGYWVHRIAHEYNFFWNNHIVHHSSEEFNLACALRQSISVFVKIFSFLLLPAALLGVDAKVIAIVAPLHLFAQFWYHTQHIGKMGFLEQIIVTPSHHRVHHAINKEYMDKNYGQIFIVWDKLFGTYQEESKNIIAVYGITRPVQTWNPIKINFQHLLLLIKDAWRTNNWKDKLRIWLMPTGWRPQDVVEKYPVYKIEDVYNFEKYDTKSSLLLHIWSWFQITMLLLFVSYLFANIANINRLNTSLIYLYGGFIFLFVYAMTDLMDKNNYAFISELLKNILGICCIIKIGDWFGVSKIATIITPLLSAYFLLSTIVTFTFCYSFRKDKSLRLPI
jgi:sterol desaturase/sphingolipid hydroxylase (fatty acid hydroxylase superfamily)